VKLGARGPKVCVDTGGRGLAPDEFDARRLPADRRTGQVIDFRGQLSRSTGRSKDVIIRKGENIQRPAGEEDVLRHPQ